MKLLLVGAGGTIGQAVATALAQRHEVIGVSRTTSPLRVDMASPESVRALLQQAGPVDGVVCTAGAARFKPLLDLQDEDFDFSLQNKLMGQVNLARAAFATMREGGVIVLTSGILARAPAPGTAAITLVNAGVEAFARAAALEAPRHIRINVVSPPWVSETLAKMGRDPKGGAPAAVVARSYVQAVEGTMTGRVLEVAA